MNIGAAARSETLSRPQPTPAAASWSSVVVARVLIVALSILLPLVLLEVGFRTLGPFLPGEYVLGVEREYDPLLGWRLRPNFVGGKRTSEFAVRFTVNQRGLRDEDIPYAKPASGLRVLTLGDSFIEATHVQLEQAMSKQLQGLLRAALAPRPVEVINAGVAAYGTAQQYLYLDREGYKYDPDVVLLVFFVGNDLTDNVRSTYLQYERPVFEVDDEGRLSQVQRPDRDRPRRVAWDEPLVRNSTVYNFLQSGVFLKLGQAAKLTGEGGREAGQDYQLYKRRPSRKVKDAWEVTEALIGAMAHRTEQINGRLVVVAAPSNRQLDSAHFDTLIAQEGLEPRQFDVELPNRLLGEAAARQNAAFIDLLPALRRVSAAGDDLLYYPKNAHWTPLGQRVVAETVYDYLVSNVALSATAH